VKLEKSLLPTPNAYGGIHDHLRSLGSA
jgi:hypothetical protein